MLRNTIRRGGISLALLLALGLGLIGATPAAAQGFRSVSTWDEILDWVAGLFGLSQPADGNNGSLSHVWENEGAGFDPFGQPLPQSGPTTDEGAGFDPFGNS